MAPYYECIMVAPQEGKLTTHARAQGTSVRIQHFPLMHTMYEPDQDLAQKVFDLHLHPEYQTVVQLIKDCSPDVVMTNTVVNILPAMAAKSLNIPVVWKITEVMRETPYTPVAIQLIDQYSDWVIAISRAAGSMLEGHILSPISYLSPSADHTKFYPSSSLVRRKERRRLSLKDREYCIGYISAFIHPEKGLREFVSMALSLCAAHPMCRFLIIGRPADLAYYDSCMTEVKQSPYKRRFQWIPYVESVQKVYSAMDILVVPSMVAEGFGMTALEGMLCGTPVVAYSNGGLGEMMEQTGNGHLVATPGDFLMLAAKVSEVLHNPAALTASGEHNARAARDLYGIEAYITKLHHLVGQWQLHNPSWFQAELGDVPQPNTSDSSKVANDRSPRRKRTSRKKFRFIKHAKKLPARRAKRKSSRSTATTKSRHKRKIGKVRSSSKYRKHG
ncbi:glycosyltransferase family 4 protein [Paenibacillus pini]|nr:glycosyltransferase family 4 protein [Paenibacillus pini]